MDVFAHFFYQVMTTAESHTSPAVEEDDFASMKNICDDTEIIERLDFMEERELEALDFVDLYEHQQLIDEDILEEEHYRACQEAGIEDVDAYQEGMALSDDEGWFYDDD